MRFDRELPTRLTAPLVAATFVALVWLERRRPLRAPAERKARRNARNLAMAVLSAAAIRATERPVTTRLSRVVLRRRWGVARILALPPWLEVAIAVVLLDYTLYVWHVLTHRVPLLWRFHEVHHADRDLDASTALRFHFAEMILSVPWRAGQIAVVGATPLALSVWQTLTLLAILFHHSNVRLPIRIERRLARILMTPRLHGIHHSIVRDQTDANWGTILSVPDHLHGTARRDVPQAAITIGTPTPRPGGRRLPDLLRRPFRGWLARQRPF
jgi:sterol desaturase/sphingolipid hydroxylase (fatty acid hydroxylase superfamily)